MRRLPALTLSLVATFAIVALAACSSGSAPAWTYAPAPSASPAASGAESGAPSGSPAASISASTVPPPSVGASGGPSAGTSAGASGGATGLTVTAPVGAATAGFQTSTLETAAGTPFTLTFDNQDNQAPHNLVLQNPDGTPVKVTGDTAFFTGPGQRVYQVPALTAGAYPFMCQVHPATMKGILTVK
ncbi:MAG TPA: cupredoxin domain-containing protein [Candidatus Limnocylindrales bacterium]|jgi:plastocyanin